MSTSSELLSSPHLPFFFGGYMDKTRTVVITDEYKQQYGDFNAYVSVIDGTLKIVYIDEKGVKKLFVGSDPELTLTRLQDLYAIIGSVIEILIALGE